MSIDNIGGVGSPSAVADLMEILQAEQAKSLDLVKKMIKIEMASSISPIQEDGKGQNIDTLA